MAEAVISAFAATATYDIPAYVTASPRWDGTYDPEVPEWFSALPANVQSIKLQEGKAMMLLMASGFFQGYATASQETTKPVTTTGLYMESYLQIRWETLRQYPPKPLSWLLVLLLYLPRKSPIW
jgi:hypothetical protein